ncbi:MAG TPA: hypothetical protein VMW42_08705, partial [Desulfatiglandales bacterium]|nr:hypothetical protein [Desulfatiglandales bacterium]
MTFTELLRNGICIDLALLALIFFILFSTILARLKMNKKIEDMEKKITSIKKYQDDIFEGLNSRYASIRGVLVDKINKLTLKL